MFYLFQWAHASVCPSFDKRQRTIVWNFAICSQPTSNVGIYQWTFIRCWKWTWRWVLRLHKKAIINITLQTKLDKILLWRLHKIIFYFTIAFSQISELPCYSLFDQCILRRRKSRGSIVKPEGTVYYLLFLTPIPRLNIFWSQLSLYMYMDLQTQKSSFKKGGDSIFKLWYTFTGSKV